MGERTIPTNDSYEVVVRILPQGEEVDLELPSTSTGKMIKESLLSHDELDIPKVDHEGNRYNYKLTSKGAGKEITDLKTLFECGVKSGDTLLLVPVLVAG